MFTARRYDLEILRSGSGRTGLYYFRARYYNQYIGRFLQLDPAYQGMNWYAYCGNNPLNCVYPSGLLSIGGAGSYIWGGITGAGSYLYSWSVFFNSQAFDRPLVYVTVQYYDQKNATFKTGKKETFFRQIGSKQDLFDFLFIKNNDPCNRIVKLQIVGHEQKTEPGSLLIQTDLSNVDNYEMLHDTFLNTEYMQYCHDNGVQWTSSGFENLVLSRYAPDAIITLGWCNSNGGNSVGFTLKKMHPNSKIWGFCTLTFAFTYAPVSQGIWHYIGFWYRFKNKK